MHAIEFLSIVKTGRLRGIKSQGYLLRITQVVAIEMGETKNVYCKGVKNPNESRFIIICRVIFSYCT